MRLRLFSIYLILLILPFIGFSQIAVTPGGDPDTLAANLVRPGINISNVQLNCLDDPTLKGFGTFDGTSSNLGIGQGVVLTSGYVNDIVGPNTSSSTSRLGSDLCEIDLNNEFALDSCCLRCETTTDACYLEFDFQAVNDYIFTTFVFGSEEYPEFVCSEYHDVFAMFLSGPGITGQQNIALLPDSITRVDINTVNPGVAGPGFALDSCEATTNSAFYVDNIGGATVAYDGFTTPIEAAFPVTPCQTYHIKYAVADVSDRYFDSGVFIQDSSVSSYDIDIVHDGLTVFENCNISTVTFNRTPIRPVATTLNYTITGSATNGTDFDTLSGTITIPADSAFAFIVIDAFEDSIMEGSENLIISLEDCNGDVYESVTVPIEDCIVMDEDDLVLNAHQQEGNIRLNWMGLEAEGLTYWIDRSEDGENFYAIHEMTAEAASQMQYHIDANAEAGKLYTYRLRTQAGNGTMLMSDAVELRVQYWKPMQVGTFFPNPTKAETKLSVRSPSHDVMVLTLVNTLGQQVMQIERSILAGENELDFDFASLPAGTYYAQIRTTDAYFQQRLVIE